MNTEPITYRWRGTTSRGQQHSGQITFERESTLGAMVAARYRAGWRYLLVVRGPGPVPPGRNEDPAALIDRGEPDGQRVWWAEAGERTSAETAGTYKDPDVLERDDLDLTGLRRHVRAEHAFGAIRGVPRSNHDLTAWHANQHHRYQPRHIHRGRYVVILDRDGRRPVAGQPRPAGWFTGQESVSREQLDAESRQRTRPEVPDAF